jgi:hypothetical protein
MTPCLGRRLAELLDGAGPADVAALDAEIVRTEAHLVLMKAVRHVLEFGARRTAEQGTPPPVPHEANGHPPGREDVLRALAAREERARTPSPCAVPYRRTDDRRRDLLPHLAEHGPCRAAALVAAGLLANGNCRYVLRHPWFRQMPDACWELTEEGKAAFAALPEEGD